MGTTLYNKIYLGRSSMIHLRRVQAALLIGAFASIGLMWFAIGLLIK